MMHKISRILISSLLLFSALTQAETVYVIDELKIGLHESASVNSPIIKLVPSGTELTVIERNEDLVKVSEPEGAQGWINKKYLLNNKPGKARINELEKEIELLKSGTLMTGENTAGNSEEQKELLQQLNSERLKSGELQAQLADLRARIANVDDSDQFIADIDQLKQENEQLRSQLESSGIEVTAESNEPNIRLHGWKEYLIAIILIFIIGMIIGAIILDYLNRRRHGGFRV